MSEVIEIQTREHERQNSIDSEKFFTDTRAASFNLEKARHSKYMKIIQKVVRRIILLVKSVKEFKIDFDYKSLEISQFLDLHHIELANMKENQNETIKDPKHVAIDKVMQFVDINTFFEEE